MQRDHDPDDDTQGGDYNTVRDEENKLSFYYFCSKSMYTKSPRQHTSSSRGNMDERKSRKSGTGSEPKQLNRLMGRETSCTVDVSTIKLRRQKGV
jgi:hypothetical protein